MLFSLLTIIDTHIRQFIGVVTTRTVGCPSLFSVGLFVPTRLYTTTGFTLSSRASRSLNPKYVGVLRCKFMAALTMCFSSIDRAKTFASKTVYPRGYGFYVNGINAMPTATQVIGMGLKANRLYEQMEEESMDYVYSPSKCQPSISTLVNSSSPEPTGRTVEGISRIDSYIAKDMLQQFSAEDDFDRIGSHGLFSFERWTDYVGLRGSLIPSIAL